VERKQDPEGMDRIAKTLFAPVCPVLAECFLTGFGRRDGTCLDLGSGPGHLAMVVAQASAMKVYALDRSVEAQEIIGKNLRNAGLEGKVIPLAGDVAKIPLPDASVDLVVSRGSVYFRGDLPDEQGSGLHGDWCHAGHFRVKEYNQREIKKF